MRAERGEDARREYVRACVFGQRTLARPSSVGSVNVQQYHSVVRVQYTTHTTAAAQVTCVSSRETKTCNLGGGRATFHVGGPPARKRPSVNRGIENY